MLDSIMGSMGYAKAGYDMVLGLTSFFNADEIGKQKKKLLQSQVNINKKKIQEALTKNYAATLSKYATERNSVTMQRLNADAGLRMNLVQQQSGDIDINESSFRGTAYGKLDTEFEQALDQIRENNKNNLLTLTTQAIDQKSQQDMMLSKGSLQINAEVDQTKSQALQQVTGGIIDATNRYMDSVADAKQQDLISEQLQDIKGNIVSGTDYYQQKKGWGSYIKKTPTSSDGGVLKLNYF